MIWRHRWALIAVVAVAALMAEFVWARVRAVTADDIAVVIPVATYAPGTVRLDQGVWVARQPSGEFYVFLDRDPHRGQQLNWVEARGMFMQAAVYLPDGSCLEGPCSAGPGNGLFQVEARLEGNHLVVFPGRVISGGLTPTPAWVTQLRGLLRPARPAAPAPARP